MANELYTEESIELRHVTEAQKKEVITILAKEITSTKPERGSS